MYSRPRDVGEDGSLALDEDDGVALVALQVLRVDQVGDVALDQEPYSVSFMSAVLLGAILELRWNKEQGTGNKSRQGLRAGVRRRCR